MAIIRSIKRVTKDHKAQGDVNCFASDYTDGEGKRYLQLDTTGSKEKEVKGATDQSIRFDENIASQIKQLIEETFPSLR